MARASDVVVLVVGNHPTCNAGWAKCPLPSDGKDAIDRQSITLPQEELVKQVFAVNPHTVVVLIASFPFALTWTEEHIPAILHMAHNSQEEGNALADALFGDYNPGGRLVTTWPRSLDQLPPMMDYDIRHGRTYMYFNSTPLYPFGYGLSYSSFEYSNLKLSAPEMSVNGDIQVSAEVRNTSARQGDEVVEMYVAHEGSAVARPREELKGFRRIRVGPGKKMTVNFVLRASDLAYWSVEKGAWEVERDKVRVMIGSSSADIHLSKILRVQ